MKTLASILMLLFVLHCACMGRCLAEESSKQPPCHHQKEQSKQYSNLCSEGPAVEAKSSPVVKCTLELVGMPCVTPTVAPTLTYAWESDSTFLFENVSPPLLRLTVLRI